MQSCKAHERRNFYDHEVFCLATNLGRGFLVLIELPKNCNNNNDNDNDNNVHENSTGFWLGEKIAFLQVITFRVQFGVNKRE